MLNNPKREALRRVRHLIRTREFTFICFALDHVAFKSKELRPACEQLKRYIATALKPSSTIQDWQMLNGHGDRSAEERRLDRLAWIDWMLEERADAAH